MGVIPATHRVKNGALLKNWMVFCTALFSRSLVKILRSVMYLKVE